MSEKIERLTLAKAITRGLEDAMKPTAPSSCSVRISVSSAACTV